jgi:nitrate reductase gamma subunit
MTAVDWLNWARGPGLQISTALLLFGMTVRVLEIFTLGRRKDLAVARGGSWIPGIATVVRRSLPAPGIMRSSGVTFIAGYVFHIGFILVLLFFVPHILLFKQAFGIEWPGMSASLTDAIAVITIATMIALLIHRLLDPVRRFLSTFQDYFTWLLTILPLITGYMAVHRMVLPYTNMLAIHILSVELLLVAIPFTKLSHIFTFLIARWYNGAMAGRRGVRA